MGIPYITYRCRKKKNTTKIEPSNRYILKGKLEEGVDCIKVGNTWLLDDRRVQTFFNK